MSSTSLCIVAGEPSGDLHGSLLIAEIRKSHPDWDIWGVGSERMAAAGCDLWRDARDWAVMGFSGVLRSLPSFRRRLRDLAAEIARRRPAGVVLIDYPGFNLRLARRVHALGIGVLYYIVPQIWAWGGRRIKVFRRDIDRAIVMFKFEQEFFAARGVQTDWVGHPLVDLVKPSASREELRQAFGVAAGERLITLLPGARAQDFESHLPVFTESVGLLSARVPGVRAALGLAPVMADIAKRYAAVSSALIVSAQVYDLVAASDLVITKTGTTTVECALLGVPMVTAYRMGRVNYAIARRLVRVPYVAMPNLIAGRRIVPELIQNAASADAIARAAEPLLCDEKARADHLDGLAEVRAALGAPGAVERAARLVGEWIEDRVAGSSTRLSE